MKLLFFSHTLRGGGAERVLVNLTNELVCQGHDVTISLNEHESNYKLDPRIKIFAAEHRLWYKGKNLIYRFLRNIRMRHFYSKHTQRAIKVIQPDVIITFLHCNLSAIIKYHRSIPIIHSEHNAYDRSIGWKGYYRRFFLNRFFNYVCVLTPFDQGYAKGKFMHNTVIMPNPNSFESINHEEYDSIFPFRKNILVCGNTKLWYIKGLDIAIKAFAGISKNHTDIYLDIVGDTDNDSLNYLKDLTVHEGVSDRVNFLGHKSDIKELLRQHKVLLLTSRTEGFPMIVTEALSQGLPCLSFERLVSTIVVDGVDGIQTQNMDMDLLVRNLDNMLCDVKLLYRMGLAGAENIKRYSASVIANKWDRLLSKSVSKNDEL